MNYNSCKCCGSDVLKSSSYCVNCGTKYYNNQIIKVLKLGHNKISPHNTSRRGSLATAIVDSFVIAFSIFVFWQAAKLGDYERSREQVREKACYANMRVIHRAVEMYNIDRVDKMDTLEQTSYPLLIKEKCLKWKPSMYAGCGYYSKGDLSVSGVISCHKHGNVAP